MSSLALTIDKDSPTPMWVQIRDQIRLMVQDGTLEPEQKLPPVRTLAADLDVSVSVVNQAYRYLRLVGYLEARQGSGVRVRRVRNPSRGCSRQRLVFSGASRVGSPGGSLLPLERGGEARRQTAPHLTRSFPWSCVVSRSVRWRILCFQARVFLRIRSKHACLRLVQASLALCLARRSLRASLLYSRGGISVSSASPWRNVSRETFVLSRFFGRRLRTPRSSYATPPRVCSAGGGCGRERL